MKRAKKGVIPRLLDFAPLTSLVLVSEPRTEPQFYGEQFIYARWARPLLGNPPPQAREAADWADSRRKNSFNGERNRQVRTFCDLTDLTPECR
jgi:hypothetical protein